LEKAISLDGTLIIVDHLQTEIQNGQHKIDVKFHVTSEDYHDITTLLYKGTFDVVVPETDLAFRGSIQEYSTSITNLYEGGRVGEFVLSLVEVNK
jgi:hypothetical protein